MTRWPAFFAVVISAVAGVVLMDFGAKSAISEIIGAASALMFHWAFSEPCKVLDRIDAALSEEKK